MADTVIVKPIMSLIATTSPKVKDLVIKNGQLIFIQDLGRIAFDFKGKRVFYNQIVELNTEAERQLLETPLAGYYFIIETATLWHYLNGWTQITEKPKDIVFVGVELPELGQEKTIYVNKEAKEISVWDDGEYITVSNYTGEASADDIENLFN